MASIEAQSQPPTELRVHMHDCLPAYRDPDTRKQHIGTLVGIIARNRPDYFTTSRDVLVTPSTNPDASHTMTMVKRLINDVRAIPLEIAEALSKFPDLQANYIEGEKQRLFGAIVTSNEHIENEHQHVAQHQAALAALELVERTS